MSEGIPYADIVIIALIAGFILLRLRNVLGQKTGHDNPQFFKKQQEIVPERKDTVVQLHEKILKPKSKEDNDPYMATLSDAMVVQYLKDIKAKDAQFNLTQFMDGAKMAFEMVFDAFAKGDTQTLKLLLADNVFNEFNHEIEKRNAQENKEETTLVAVTKKELVQARLTGNMAQLTVKFTSEQIIVTRNAEGQIIEGDVSDTQDVESEWVFERDVTSKNPNWKIIET